MIDVILTSNNMFTYTEHLTKVSALEIC